MEQSFLLYDGSRRLFRRLASALEARASDLTLIPLSSPTGEEFLDAQFGDRPFAIVLVTDETVYAGGTALSRLLERYGAGDHITRPIERLYDVAGGAFGRVVHGAVPDDIDGQYPLDSDARTALGDADGVSIEVTDANDAG